MTPIMLPDAAASQRRPLFIACGIVLLLLLLHQVMVTRAAPDALYMDSLRLLRDMDDWQAGRMSLLALWTQGSAHHGLVNQAALLANMQLFSLDVLLVNRFTGAVVAGVALLLLSAFLREPVWRGAGPVRIASGARWGVGGLMAALCFSWAGFELFTLDLGFPLWIKNLCFVGFFAGHAAYLSGLGEPGRPWLARGLLLSLAGMFVVLFVGMGWSYAFVVAVLAVTSLFLAIQRRRMPLRSRFAALLPAVALVVAVALYVAAGSAQGEGEGLSRLASDLPNRIWLALHALGAAWIGVEVLPFFGMPLDAAAWLGLLTCGAALWAGIARLRRGLLAGSLLPLYLLGYGALMAVSVSIARGDGGAAQVMASRYHMDLVLFLFGTLWLCTVELAARGFRPRAPSLVFAAVCLLVGATLTATMMREWKAAPYRAAAFEAMNRALAMGVPDQAAADLLQSPLEHARAGARLLREHRLAVFAEAPVDDACAAASITRLEGWNAPEGSAMWMGRSGVLSLPACSCRFVADVYLPDAFPARTLSVTLDGGGVGHFELMPGQSKRVELEGGATARVLRAEVSRATTPALDLAGQLDQRELGALWSNLGFACDLPGAVRRE